MKITPKRLILLKAAQTKNVRAGKAGVKSKRIYNISVDFEPGDFNAQFDYLEEHALVVLGAYADGSWGPRYVHITAKGQEVLKNL